MLTIKKMKLLKIKEQFKIKLIMGHFKNIFFKKKCILNQFNQLDQYHKEYYKSLHLDLLSGINSISIKCYLDFLNLLENNIKLQIEQLSKCNKKLELISIDLKSMQEKINIYKNLELKIHQNKILKEETNQQKYNDEFSSLLFLKKV
ncbi:Flagellar FliJ protein [Buchnera aphidicola (Eriosoma grossulariae)]|uniref:flagellar export protein FliJ n=1 Tax=Buchnera aphidicola TaxID=9 RepID=UPI003463AF49